MKYLKPTLTIALLLTTLICADAWARPGHVGGGHPHAFVGGHVGGPGYVHGGHAHGYWRGGVFIGAPLFWPGYWYDDPFYYPYYHGYYSSAPYYLPPDVPAGSIPPGATVSYYCGNPKGYYPSIAECRIPWRVVTTTQAPPP